MSHDYESYGKVSGNYDLTREPTGLDKLIEILSASQQPIDKLNLVSIGCGTGSYEIELAKNVRRVVGIDLSAGMIDKASEKSREIPNVSFLVGDATNLPIQNQKFDAALFILSLHHIGNHDSQIRALEEAYNVLKPGALLVVQTISQRQLRDGIWYHDLIPEASVKLAEKYIPIEDLTRILEKTGFEYKEVVIPKDAVFQGRSYLDITGILRKQWRDGVSTFSLASHQELRQAQTRVIKMIRNGTIQSYIKEREALRAETGQLTYVYAIKK